MVREVLNFKLRIEVIDAYPRSIHFLTYGPSITAEIYITGGAGMELDKIIRATSPRELMEKLFIHLDTLGRGYLIERIYADSNT